MRRNRQPSVRPLDHLDRLTDQTAGDIVFVLSVWDLESPHHEQGVMHARDHRDRTRLAALVITPFDQIAMLAFGAHYRGHVRPLVLHAISAVIDPAGVGVLHDHHAPRADIVAAVVLVPARRRDRVDVHVFAAADVLHERTGFHFDRCEAARFVHVFAPIGDELDRRSVERHANGEIDAAH